MKTENKKTTASAKELVVKEPATLLPFLLAGLAGESRTSIKSYLVHRQVMINDMVSTKHDAPLAVGDRVAIVMGRVAQQLRHQMLRIVFEDDHIIVADKRNGLLSMGTDREKDKTAYTILSNHVKRADPKNLIFIVHRLDRETSGLMLFAKSEKAQSILQRNWNEMVLERKYVAVVEGSLSRDEGMISAHLTENKGYKVFVSTQGDGTPAITHYKVLRRKGDYSLLELSLETGRKNQIRAHLEYVGNPVAGDKKYGGSPCKADRVCLHAYKLRFIHPITRKELDFETKIPAAFTDMV